MPKKTVKFSYTDGRKVRRQPPSGTFNLRTQAALVLPPGAKVRLALGVSCDHPVHVFQSRAVLKQGVELADGIWAATDADQEIILFLENKGKATVYFESGDVLARCFVMDNSALEPDGVE